MISVSYHDTVNALQQMIANPAGDELGPFDRAEWLALVAKAGTKPLIAIARSGDRWAALAFSEANGRLQSLINWYSFVWRPIGGQDPAVLAALASNLRTKSHRVTLWPLPDEHGTASALEAAFCASGWNVRREQCDHNHVLEVKGRSFADYWASRPGRMRTTLKRKSKKVTVEIVDHFRADAWQAYENIYAHSWKPEEGDPAMLRAFAQQEGDAGRIRLAVARHDGQAVAAQFWTVENHIGYIHKLAHLEKHKTLSAGTTLTAALFKHVIDKDRVDLIDFGTGDDPYKRDWMELDRPRFRLDCLDPAQPRAWPALGKRAVLRVARSFGRS